MLLNLPKKISVKLISFTLYYSRRRNNIQININFILKVIMTHLHTFIEISYLPRVINLNEFLFGEFINFIVTLLLSYS